MTAGMVCYYLYIEILLLVHSIVIPSGSMPSCSINFTSCRLKGSEKTIKKVASSLVRDAEKSWFAELSDKGRKMTK